MVLLLATHTDGTPKYKLIHFLFNTFPELSELTEQEHALCLLPFTITVYLCQPHPVLKATYKTQKLLNVNGVHNIQTCKSLALPLFPKKKPYLS